MCSVHVRLQILSQVPFFSALKHDDLEQINRLFREKGYSPEEICFAGDPAEHLFVVAEGHINL